jgi:hypothetical protein
MPLAASPSRSLGLVMTDGAMAILSRLISDRLYEGEGFDQARSDLIDGFNQIVVVEPPPLVAGKWSMSCQRR